MPIFPHAIQLNITLIETFRFDFKNEFDYKYDFQETFRFDYEYEFDYECDFLKTIMHVSM